MKSLVFIAMLCALGAARAQDRAIHVVVPLLAGSGTDAATRTFVAALSQRLGQPIVVENKARRRYRSGCAFRRQEHARRLDAACGHDEHAVAHAPSVQKPPYDTQKDLAPIVGVLGLAARLSALRRSRSTRPSPISSPRRRQSPGKLTFGFEPHRHAHPHGGRAARRGGAGYVHRTFPYKGVTRRVRGRDRRPGGLPRRRARLDAAQVRGNRIRALVVTAPQRLADAAGGAHGRRGRHGGRGSRLHHRPAVGGGNAGRAARTLRGRSPAGGSEPGLQGTTSPRRATSRSSPTARSSRGSFATAAPSGNAWYASAGSRPNNGEAPHLGYCAGKPYPHHHRHEARQPPVDIHVEDMAARMQKSDRAVQHLRELDLLLAHCGVREGRPAWCRSSRATGTGLGAPPACG